MKQQLKETSISKDSLEGYNWSNSNNSDFIDIDNKNGRVASIDLFAFEELGLTKDDAINEAKKICEAVNKYNALKEANEWMKGALEEAVNHSHVYDTNPALMELFQTALQKAKQL